MATAVSFSAPIMRWTSSPARSRHLRRGADAQHNPKYLGRYRQRRVRHRRSHDDQQFPDGLHGGPDGCAQSAATGCGTDIATCAAAGAPDRFSNLAQDKADYIARLTYGLPTLSFAQAPREAAPAAGLTHPSCWRPCTAAIPPLRKRSPERRYVRQSPDSTINQIIMNTETNAIAAFYGTPLSYWSRLDLFSAKATSRASPALSHWLQAMSSSPM